MALPTLSPFIVCVSSSAPNGGIRAIYERKDCASGWHLFGVAGLVFGISTLSGGCSAYWRLLRGILVLLDTSSLVTPMAPTTRAIYIDAVHGLQRRLLALRGLWGCRAAAHKCQTVMPGGHEQKSSSGRPRPRLRLTYAKFERFSDKILPGLRGCNFGVIQGKMASFSGFRVKMAGKAGALARLTAGAHQLILTPVSEPKVRKILDTTARQPPLRHQSDHSDNEDNRPKAFSRQTSLLKR